MPHFIIDCSETIIKQKLPQEIMEAVYDIAKNTTLFDENDIKVRMQPYKHFKLANDQKDFIHVFAYLMEGRTIDQKAKLSELIIKKLNLMFPEISILSISIQNFEKATYCNKTIINNDLKLN